MQRDRKLPQVGAWLKLEYGPKHPATWACAGEVRAVVDGFVIVVRRWVRPKARRGFQYQLINLIDWAIFPYIEVTMPTLPQKIGIWTGPNEGELDAANKWHGALPIPPERWPYGPPEAHDAPCILHTGGRFCDCSASDESA